MRTLCLLFFSVIVCGAVDVVVRNRTDDVLTITYNGGATMKLPLASEARLGEISGTVYVKTVDSMTGSVSPDSDSILVVRAGVSALVCEQVFWRTPAAAASYGATSVGLSLAAFLGLRIVRRTLYTSPEL